VSKCLYPRGSIAVKTCNVELLSGARCDQGSRREDEAQAYSVMRTSEGESLHEDMSLHGTM
jgi:hypothetical protein